MRNKKIDKSNVKDILSLSPIQKSMLYHYINKECDDMYLEQLTLSLNGSLTYKELKKSLISICKSYDVLRTVFRWQETPEPIQVILKEYQIPSNYIDYSQNTDSEKFNLINQYKQDDIGFGIDICSEPFRVSLCNLGNENLLLIITFHHILLDGWSLGMIVSNLIRTINDLTYTDKLSNHGSYKDYIKWVKSQDKMQAFEFWKKKLDNFSGNTHFPFRTKKDSSLMKYRQILSNDLSKRIRTFAIENHITLASLIYSAWGILMQRFNDSDDVIFGITKSTRPTEIQHIRTSAGLYINTVPIRMTSQSCDTLIDFVYSINQTLVEMNEYDFFPLEELRSLIPSSSAKSLFDSIVVVENYPITSDSGSGKVQIKSYEMIERTNFPIVLAVTFNKDIELTLNIGDYSFEEHNLVKMIDLVVELLDKIVSEPFCRYSELNLGFKYQSLRLPKTTTKYVFKSIHKLFEEQVIRTPQKYAIKLGDETISYSELNYKSNQAARYLRKEGLKKKSIVAIVSDFSIDMAIILLAVIKAGAAYLPISPSTVVNDVNRILSDTKPNLILTDNAYFPISDHIGRVLYINKDSYEFESGVNLNDESSPDDIAYIIYTSGSTCNPRCVIVKNEGISNALQWRKKEYKLNANDVSLQLFSFAFDGFLTSFFSPLISGATLILMKNLNMSDSVKIQESIVKQGVTDILCTPSLYNVIVNRLSSEDVKALRRVTLAGEQVKESLIIRSKELSQEIEVNNEYGPTENSVVTSFKRDLKIGDHITIGKAIDNVQVIIVNRQNGIQVDGMIGEICVYGKGIAEGYLNNNSLTKEKFVPCLLDPNQIMYKTGDKARILDSGEMEFLGRVDTQLKIRGFRVEIEQIEEQLNFYDKIDNAVVIKKLDENDNSYLHAYYSSKNKIDVSVLRLYLSQVLPTYMIPTFFTQTENIPLTSSGKIDRRSLSKKLDQVVESVDRDASIKLNELETKICLIWESKLNKNVKFTIYDNFFDVGGNSLLLMEIQISIKKELGIDLSIKELLRYPTIKTISNYIKEGAKNNQDINRSEKKLSSQRGNDNRIAIIGIALRFPEANNINEYWQNLYNGVESITYHIDDSHKKEPTTDINQKNEYVVHAGGYIKDFDSFDAEFFNYSPREAKVLDPQHRLFLEECWKALDDSGYNSESYGGKIGVFAGSTISSYLLNVLNRSEVINSYGAYQTILSNDKDFLATKVSYSMNLTGPSASIQTACSSSLSAVHAACQSIISNECKMAIAGGVTIRIPHNDGYLYRKGGIFSPDGHCRSFDKNANGTVPGNGVGVVVLKKLNDAIGDRDNIYAVIKGSAINNDGSNKLGYTAPSIASQADVIRSAIEEARLVPENISFVEAHGTGTELGDVIEFEALKEVFSTGNIKEKYCALGSVKNNIGHLDVAAGVAGLIKTALVLKNRIIPPMVNFESPNPNFNFEDSPFYINKSRVDIQANKGKVYAGVSSFGMGGTNVHMILEEAPSIQKLNDSKEWKLILLSARKESALKQLSHNFVKSINANNTSDISNIAYTLQVGRKEFMHRVAVLCRNKEEAVSNLLHMNKSRYLSGVVDCTDRKLVFMFSGQGSQYIDMGKELYDSEPFFREQIDYCSDKLIDLMNIDIRKIVFSCCAEDRTTSEILMMTEFTQPVLFVLEYCIALLWIKWGINPDCMIGHSIGEYVAACISGVFSLEDALRLVAMRGKLMQKIPTGCMLSVLENVDKVRLIMNDDIDIAAVNTSRSCVCSGEYEAIEKLKMKLDKLNIQNKIIKTSHAFHSKMMLPMIDEYLNTLKQIDYREPQIPYVSSVTGDWIIQEQVCSSEYWLRQIYQEVRFYDGIARMKQEQPCIFLEIGPGNSLSSMVLFDLKDNEKSITYSSLPHQFSKVSEVEHISKIIAQMWVTGVRFDWDNYNDDYKMNRVSLPSYPFEKQKYMIGNNQNCDTDSKKESHSRLRNVYYSPQWELSIDEFDMNSPKPRTWLLFSNNSLLDENIISLLEKRGHKVIRIIKGDQYVELTDDTYAINQKDLSSYVRLCKCIKESNYDIEGIIHTWNIEVVESDLCDRSLFENYQYDGFYSVCSIVDALDKCNFENGMDIFVLSNKLFDVSGSENIIPEKATVLGLSRVIEQEYSNYRCFNIDIGHIKNNSPMIEYVTNQLYKELSCLSSNKMIAYRGKKRWVQNIKPLSKKEKLESDKFLRPGGTYLITGGVGNIGLALAKSIAKDTDINLVLLGKRDIPDRCDWNKLNSVYLDDEIIQGKIKKLLELERYCGEITVMSVDITDLEEYRLVVNRILKKYDHIDGVIHAAGSINDNSFNFIHDNSLENVNKQFGPKIHGYYNTKKLLGENLDFFINISSIASFLGGIRYSSYCAANIFLDHCAIQENKNSSIRHLSINWDAWIFSDIERNSDVSNELDTCTINEKEGIIFFKELLKYISRDQILVTKRVFDPGSNRIVAYDDMLRNKNSFTKIKESQLSYRNKKNYSKEEVIEELTTIWIELLDNAMFDRYNNFFEIGGNSLLGVEMISRIRQAFDVDIQLLSLYEHPTINALAELIFGKNDTMDEIKLSSLRGVKRRKRIKRRKVSNRFEGNSENGNE